MNPGFFANGNVRVSRFVKIDSTAGKVFNVIESAAATDKSIGISYEGAHDAPGVTGSDGYAAVAGENIRVYTVGDICNLTLGGTVTQGDWLVSDSAGRGVTQTSGANIADVIGAIALDAGAVNELRRVLVIPMQLGNTSAGGTVTQITSITTGVTLSKYRGQITTVAASTAAGAEDTFTVTNTLITALDTVSVSTTYAGAGLPLVFCSRVAAGSFNITISNLHAADALNALLVINFVIHKGATS